MNWYEELVTYAGLGLDYDKVLDRFSVDRLMSATYLLNPLVSNFDNVVVARDGNVRLYDVSTDIMEDGKIKIFGRVFGTVKPFVRRMEREEFLQNFIIITKTTAEIRGMLKERNK